MNRPKVFGILSRRLEERQLQFRWRGMNEYCTKIVIPKSLAEMVTRDNAGHVEKLALDFDLKLRRILDA